MMSRIVGRKPITIRDVLKLLDAFGKLPTSPTRRERKATDLTILSDRRVAQRDMNDNLGDGQMSCNQQARGRTQKTSFKRSLSGLLTGLSLSTVLLIVGGINPQLAIANDQGPLTNLGFESGSTSPWAVEEADSVSVIISTTTTATTETATTTTSTTETFSKDKNTSIAVSPYLGNSMLRMGSPKQISEKQIRGTNKVTQTFDSDGNKILISFRLFSWEHRGDDTFRLDLKDGTGKGFPISGFNVTMPGGATTSCSQTPCDVTIDVGKRGNFLNTGWMVVEIDTSKHADDTDVAVDTHLTLEYTLIGGENDAHATWGYFDSVNTPPVAKFDFTPKGDSAFPIVEGDFVTFNDHSFDPDLGDEIVQWDWTITGLGETETFSGKEGVLILPDNGVYNVTLTVTDSFGASNTVSTGGIATDGTEIPILRVQEGAPLVKALNQEALAGSDIELIGRFIDPGVLDAGRTATWSIGDGSINCSETEPSDQDTKYCVERNIPLVASGETRATITAPSSSSDETLIIDGVNTSFHIEVLTDEQIHNGREPNENIDDAKILPVDGIYLDSIHEPNNIDAFQITNISKGGELYVKLKAPADYDLVLFKNPSELEDLAFGYNRFGFGYNRFGFGYNRFAFGYNRFAFGYNRFAFGYNRFGFGYNRFGFGYNRFAFGYNRFAFGYNRFPFATESIFANTYLTFEQFPLSELLLDSQLDGSNLGGADVSLSEIGLEGFSDMLIMGYSANRGIDEEEILISLDSADPVYAVVIGHNGAFSPIPYTLQIEASEPLDLASLLPNTCTGEEVVNTEPTTEFVLDTNTSGSSGVLFVYPEQRFQAIYGNTVKANLLGVGHVLVVPSDIYSNWDTNPCSVDAANNVAKLIGDEVHARLNNYEHVVIVGSDQMVPFLRKPDATDLGEVDFANESLQSVGTPLDVSIRGNNVLTDDCYVDNDPMLFQGRRFCLPKKSIGRLVETDSEIIAAIAAYQANDAISFESATTTGYDFFVDLAEQTNILFGSLNNNLLLTDWTAADLKCSLLGDGTDCSISDVISMNAHSSQNAVLSAYGFNYVDYLDSVFGDDVSTASNGSGKLVWTSGCHSGFPVPDGTTVGKGNLPFSPDIDLAQAFSRAQNAVFVAQTGYGLGGTNSIAGTEQLGIDFIKSLSEGTVGLALVKAKQRYINNLKSMTVYDEKVISQAVLYGLPMYTTIGANFTPANTTEACGSVDFYLSVTGVDGSSAPTSLTEVCKDDGSYYEADGTIQTTAGRAIQPKIVIDDIGGDAHGVAILGGSFEDIDNFDPIIAQNTHEWIESKNEIATCVNAYTPGEIATINTRASINANSPPTLQQTLVVVPAQFRCTDLVNDQVVGVERLYNNLELEVLNSTNTDDYVEPNIRNVDISTGKDNYVTLTILADDAGSGLDEFIILLVDETSGQITSIRKLITDIEINSSGQYIIDIDNNVIGDKKIALQAIDTAGNVANWTGKGVSLRPIYVDAFDTVYSMSAPTRLTATIKGFRQLLTNHGGDSEWIRYAWDYGDGSYDTGYLAENGDVVTDTVLHSENGDVIFTISVDEVTGDATFTIVHSYSSPPYKPAVLKITDDFGGVGVDEVILQECVDAADLGGSLQQLDLTQCGIQNDSTKVTITIGLAEEVAIADDAQYRIYLDLGPQASGGGLPDGITDVMLKYNGGRVSGLNSLIVTPIDDNLLQFEFDLEELGWSGTRIDWYAVTQDGVQAGQQQGFVDAMPDSGFWMYPTY
jgi:hypothetical protein